MWLWTWGCLIPSTGESSCSLFKDVFGVYRLSSEYHVADISKDIFHINSRGNIPIFRKSSHTMFSSYSRPGFWYVTLICISAQSGGNSWRTENPLNAPPQLSIPYVVPKQLWTLNELKAALIRKFPHLSTEEGQGWSKVTFLKVGWVKISKFLPRDLAQGEFGKIEPTGVPLEVWAGFGIGILVLAPKFPYVVSIPATHTRNSSHSTNSSHSSEGIALHS